MTAARLEGLADGMRLVSFLPESQGKRGAGPWSSICLLRNHSAALNRSLVTRLAYNFCAAGRCYEKFTMARAPSSTRETRVLPRGNVIVTPRLQQVSGSADPYAVAQTLDPAGATRE